MHNRYSFVLAAVGLLVSCMPATQVVTTTSASPRVVSTIDLPLASQDPITEPTQTLAPTPSPIPDPVISYTIGSQDTVSSIANYFSLSVRQIIELNPGLEVNPNQLFVGESLALAKGGVSKLQARTAPTPAPTPVPVNFATAPASGVLWTFDDCERYSGQGVVAGYIRVLKAYNVAQAIFFMTGDCYIARPDLVGMIKASGYEIGNHTKSHADLTNARMLPGDISFQLVNGPPKADAPRYFRPPYGRRNATVDVISMQLGYQEMLWNINSADSTESNGCPVIYANIRGARAGQIVLMHMSNSQSPRALEAALSGKGC